MKNIKLFAAALIIPFLFIGCGSSSSESFSLSDELQGESYYVVKDNLYSKGIYKIDFDTNLTKWDITVYDANFTAQTTPVSADINVTDTTITDSSGTLVYNNNNSEYINLVTQSSSLVKLKFFESKDDAQNYSNTSLQDEVKGKEFYAVQRNSLESTLFKFIFNESATLWDVTVYDSNYSTQTGSYLNMGVTVTTNRLVDGSVMYALNSIEEDYISLVNNENLTFRLYENSVDAETYYNSLSSEE
ncbi:MAG: hypothetical protein U9Q33_11965 [Campylobacterota bacterium]|nr:hypothetical protein [Campylobacterota bacterium]